MSTPRPRLRSIGRPLLVAAAIGSVTLAAVPSAGAFGALRPPLTATVAATASATTTVANAGFPSRATTGTTTDRPAAPVPAAVPSTAGATVPPVPTPGAAPLVTTTAEPGTAAAVAIRFALAQRGLPYVWGGDGPLAGEVGFDCSGLTTAAYAAAGVVLPRTAHTQFYAGPHVASGGELQPGDLVFFGVPQRVHHVGLYLGDGMMVNAPTFGRPVRIAYVRYPGDDYLGATRPAAGRDATGLVPTPALPYAVPAAPAPEAPRAPADFRAPAVPPGTPPPMPALKAEASLAPTAGRTPTPTLTPPGTTPPGTTPPGTTPPGTTPPGTTPPGTTPPGTTPPGTTPPGTTPPGTTPPGTTPPGTTPPGTTPPGTTPPGTAPPGTAPPGTSPALSQPGSSSELRPPGTSPAPGPPSSSPPGASPAPSPPGTTPPGSGPPTLRPPGTTPPGTTPPKTTAPGIAGPAGVPRPTPPVTDRANARASATDPTRASPTSTSTNPPGANPSGTEKTGAGATAAPANSGRPPTQLKLRPTGPPLALVAAAPDARGLPPSVAGRGSLDWRPGTAGGWTAVVGLPPGTAALGVGATVVLTGPGGARTVLTVRSVRTTDAAGAKAAARSAGAAPRVVLIRPEPDTGAIVVVVAS